MSDKIKLIVNDAEISLTKDELTQGIEKGELTVNYPDLLLFNKEDYEKRLKNEKDSEYKKGRKDGVEIEAKEMKRKLGLEIEGKDFNTILSAFKEQVLAENKIEPDKTIEEKNKIIKQLRDNLKAAEDEKSNLLQSFEQKNKEAQINSLLFTSIPEKAINENFTRTDIISLFKGNGYSIDIQEGKEVVMFNGEVMKSDKTLEPIPVKDALNKFIADKGLIKQPEGRAGKDEPTPSKPGTLAAFEKEMNERGLKYGSPEYIKEMQDRIANKTLIV